MTKSSPNGKTSIRLFDDDIKDIKERLFGPLSAKPLIKLMLKVVAKVAFLAATHLQHNTKIGFFVREIDHVSRRLDIFLWKDRAY